MKYQLFKISPLLFFLSLFSCSKEKTTNTVIPPSNTGSLLIWTSKPDDFTSCGPTLLVTLNTGQQSVITNYYANPPSSCIGQFGGNFSLPAADYTYTITTVGSCATITGTVTVIKGICNYSKIH